METTLCADPAYPFDAVESIRVRVERRSLSRLRLRYVVVGDVSRIRIPPSAEPLRTTGLWEATCFEAFIRREGEDRYVELNFSPSGQWAAYAFSGYRQDMRDAPLASAPRIAVKRSADRLEIEAALSADLGPGPHALNVAAILQDLEGERSFWAASHPAGGPDFHHPGCFIERLPPAPDE